MVPPSLVTVTATVISLSVITLPNVDVHCSLLEQIKSQKCKAVVGVLQAAKSKSLLTWRQLDIRITDAANEAKDNVKYLYTLDKFFGPLVKCSPVRAVLH